MPVLNPLFLLPQAVGITLRSLIQSVDEILPSLHSSATAEVAGISFFLPSAVIFLMTVCVL